MNFRKHLIYLFFLAFLTPVCSAQIAGTSHDFSSESWAPAENRLCVVCHTTHNSNAIPSAPLWNHELTAVAGYTLYSSATFDGSGSITNPSASSKLCLSCHDGTVALDSFGGASGSTYLTGSAQLGGVSGNNLSTEHPISFVYNSALSTADPGLFDPSVAPSGITITGTIDEDMLFSNKMECASCHDVHNKYGNSHLLKLDNTNSELCLTCHDK